jgi:predicted Zn-dependent protease with MMP-like domain
MTAGHATAPGLDQIEALAREAMASIPQELRARVEGVVFRIEEFPDQETCREMGLQSPFDILGLYRGIPFGEKGVSQIAQDVDMILLYRRPLLDYWCESGETLGHLIRHVLIHEIGHHFGFTDADMARMEADAAR